MTENFFGITDKGKRRDNNEDTFIAEKLSKGLQLACVIDGVGGYQGGEVAAAIARNVILEHLKKMSADVTGTLKQAIILANEKIVSEKKSASGNESMACVLTVAVSDTENNKFYYAHVGDTRLYLLRDGSLVKISKDHSVVGFLEESGRLTEGEAMRHPRRNEINKALGFEAAINPDSDFIETGESPFLPGDVLLLCSDGLSDMIGTDTITDILLNKSTLSDKGGQLIDAANDAGGNDNITAVLVENNKQSKIKAGAIPIQKKNDIQSDDVVTTNGKNVVTKTRSNTGLIAFLTLLSLALAFAFLFTLFKDTAKKQNVVEAPTMQPLVRNAGENMLIAGINDSTKMFAIASTGSPLIITNSIQITKDSFHLIGNGNYLRSDSAYKGAGLIISGGSKQVILDSLVFENFDVAVVVEKNNVIFRNVRFINCRVPVQYNIKLADSLLTGRFIDTLFTSTN